MRKFNTSTQFAVVLAILTLFAAVCGASSMESININTASVEELMDLDRVGAKYAERIVAYREANGPFERPEDIMKVKGIGSKTWEANKDRITI